MTLLFNFIGPEFLVLCIAILLLTFWIWAIVDVVRSTFKKPNDKIVFLVLTLAFPLIGTLVYFFYGRKQKVVVNEALVD